MTDKEFDKLCDLLHRYGDEPIGNEGSFGEIFPDTVEQLVMAVAHNQMLTIEQILKLHQINQSRPHKPLEIGLEEMLDPWWDDNLLTPRQIKYLLAE